MVRDGEIIITQEYWKKKAAGILKRDVNPVNVIDIRIKRANGKWAIDFKIVITEEELKQHCEYDENVQPGQPGYWLKIAGYGNFGKKPL